MIKKETYDMKDSKVSRFHIKTNFQIQIMKKFLLHFTIRINHPFFVSIYVSTNKGFGLRTTEG